MRDLWVALLLVSSASLHAAEIRVVGGSAVIPAMDALIPQFERSSGNTVRSDFDAAIGAVTARIEKGELADNGNISAAATKVSLAQIGVVYKDIGYQVRHIGECEVAGRIGRHVVMNTPLGVVTFLIMPQVKGELSSRRVMNKGLFQAVFVPQKRSAFGVIADAHMNTKQMESMMGQMFAPMKDEI